MEAFLPATHVRQVLFLATHSLEAPNHRLALHYSRQLTYAGQAARMVVLLFRPEAGTIELDGEASAMVEAPVCVWGEGSIAKHLPRLAQSVATSPSLAQTPNPNHRRYFWFHSSLLLWNVTFGHFYPSLRFLWRIEPDVLMAGSHTPRAHKRM